ncbi:MAG: hypothetical protein ACD_71C00180G0002 [uncultured bacterium (gcode 4)]|uniref:Uncharacterized protein n=1 Tax=uncultured bacterium (gcode 4) TaxID=1234023 RepID=K1ZIP4_9BACT|nr:MAG: hypothetical protein ACD_71C00180G0002 [uncultured bacterium (gcode 4)]
MNKIKIHFTDYFSVSQTDLSNYWAFNISLIADVPLFVDPFLIFNSKKPEYKELHQGILLYLQFLSENADPNQEKGLMKSWYTFSEVKQNWLWFSSWTNQGHWLWKDFAISLNRNLSSILRASTSQISESPHLEKLCLLDEWVWKDKISDFTTNLILWYLLDYTQGFAIKYLPDNEKGEFIIRKAYFNYETCTWVSQKYILPYHNREFVLLTPCDILTRDNTWINKSDLVDEVADGLVETLPNEQLRAEINQYIHSQLVGIEKPKKKEKSEAAAKAIRRYPMLLDYYIKRKEQSWDGAVRLSVDGISATQEWFNDATHQIAFEVAKNPDTYQDTLARSLFFKDCIENKDIYTVFYDKAWNVRIHEKEIQLLYRLVFHGTENSVDREVNNGRWPVDYAISMWAKDKTLVEIKLATNSKLRTNLEKQLNVYQTANNTKKGLYVIIFFTEEQEKKVRGIITELRLIINKDVILIDARKDNKPSASKTGL